MTQTPGQHTTTVVGWAQRWCFVGGHGSLASSVAGLSWEQRMEKGLVPKPCHTVTTNDW